MSPLKALAVLAAAAASAAGQQPFLAEPTHLLNAAAAAELGAPLAQERAGFIVAGEEGRGGLAEAGRAREQTEEQAEDKDFDEEEDEEESESMVTTSYLLLGFMVVNFKLLWLVNWPDANVRSYMWKMISGTISIYLAVLLNDAVGSLVLDVIISPSVAKSEGLVLYKLDVILRLTIFVGCFLAGNALCYYFREQGQWLYATEVIGGHIVGFAGIGVVDKVMEAKPDTKAIWLLLVGIIILLGVFRCASKEVRKHWACQEYKPLVPDRRTQVTDDADEWVESVCDLEDEACSIIISKVVKYLVMASLFALREKQLLKRHTISDLQVLTFAQVGWVVVLLLMTYWRSTFDRYSEKMSPQSLRVRAVNSVQTTVAMTMSWLALNQFLWLTARFVPGIGASFTKIVSAAVLTVAAIVAIILLDRLADKANDIDIQVDLVPGMGQSAAVREALSPSNLEKAVRTLIDSFALSIGLAWEHAFHAAADTVVEGHFVTSAHIVLAKLTMAGLSCLLMLPVWLKFIVPMARMHWKHHQAMMDVARKLH